ncbi:2610_t:CDS:1 [Funneliformis geosporum]|uniref:13175_t:CDS:1 n=1 Tax=Funneliformis geosporum TaxID=1117311 RepID=A0A9W4WIA9_9GLOM|nr:2610_t:CDS:1 [Funneliformis geosporum]CAI2163888.1 13175_t:CDS:1 [Funneliformis geosporum]
MYSLDNYDNYDINTPPLSAPTSPNDDFTIRQKAVLSLKNSPFDTLNHFSLRTPDQTHQFSPNSNLNFDHNQQTDYFRSQSKHSSKTLLYEPLHELACLERNQSNVRSTVHKKPYSINGDPINTSTDNTKLSTCFNNHEVAGKITIQTETKLSTLETKTREMHVMRKNSYSRVKPYQKIAPNIKVEDSSCLMKINYLLNSPIDSSSSSTTSSQNSSNMQKTKISKIKHFDKPISERKRKSNSLARVLQDRGLLESTLNITSTTFTETKSILFPNSPIMEIGELKKNIEDLNIDMSLLDDTNINIKWKGQPLNIHHLTHYSWLHPKEAHVTSILRLTPIQYLTSKYILVSSARRYIEKNLPFRKSDAQKLLRIDVNKASKLWEFFQQIKWI